MTQTLLAFTLSADEQRVWNALWWHKGHDQAITQYGLAGQCDLRPRAVREAIKSLVERHGYLICGSQDGYFIVETPEELAQAKAELYSRLVSLAVRLSRMEKSSLEYVWGQMRLRMEGP